MGISLGYTPGLAWLNFKFDPMLQTYVGFLNIQGSVLGGPKMDQM